MAFQVEFLTLFNHFLVIVGFGLFWVGNLVKVSNIGDPQASILGPTFLIFQIDDPLMMLYAILLSMLMILLSTVNVIKLLICGNR